MAVEDFLDSEVAVAVAVTAAVLSPRVRGVLRRGLVYGVAGVLKAGDALSSTVQNAAAAAQQAAGATATVGAEATKETMMSAETGTVVGMAGSAMAAVAHGAMSAAQHAALTVVQTVQEVTDQARAGLEGSRTDRPQE